MKERQVAILAKLHAGLAEIGADKQNIKALEARQARLLKTSAAALGKVDANLVIIDHIKSTQGKIEVLLAAAVRAEDNEADKVSQERQATTLEFKEIQAEENNNFDLVSDSSIK